MRRRFRRRNRGLWLPVYGNANNSNPTDFVVGNQGVVGYSDLGEITVDAWAPTFDYTTNPWGVQTTVGTPVQNLHDIAEGNEWRLRRIVGKFHAVCGGRKHPEGLDEGALFPACEVGFGYIVLKTDEEGDPLTDIAEVNPLIMESSDDPWIFRRKWILNNANNLQTVYAGNAAIGNEAAVLGNINKAYPYSTAGYNSVADGPHIDQKTNRRINRQERLFAMVATRFWNPIGVQVTFDYTFQQNIYYNLDHRFYGGLMRSTGNRRNASR